MAYGLRSYRLGQAIWDSLSTHGTGAYRLGGLQGGGLQAGGRTGWGPTGLGNQFGICWNSHCTGAYSLVAYRLGGLQAGGSQARAINLGFVGALIAVLPAAWGRAYNLGAATWGPTISGRESGHTSQK